MKRLFLYLTLFLSLILFSNCSLKHKWRAKQKEKLIHKKQARINHVLTSEQVILDTSFQYIHKQLKNYLLWELSGNVHIHANGSIQSDHATLQSWHSETDSLESQLSKAVYQNQRTEDQHTSEESTLSSRKISHQKKRKATTNLWWIVLLLIPLGVLVFRRFRMFRRGLIN